MPGIFSIVTTENLPVGLLTSIGSTFTVSDKMAGLMMTMPGLLAAVSAPVVTVAAGGIDRRRMLGAFVLLLALPNFLAAMAPSYWLVLVSRVLVGVTIGGFWSIGAGLAGRLVPAESAGRAAAVIFSAVPRSCGNPGQLSGRTGRGAVSDRHLRSRCPDDRRPRRSCCPCSARGISAPWPCWLCGALPMGPYLCARRPG